MPQISKIHYLQSEELRVKKYLFVSSLPQSYISSILVKGLNHWHKIKFLWQLQQSEAEIKGIFNDIEKNVL